MLCLVKLHRSIFFKINMALTTRCLTRQTICSFTGCYTRTTGAPCCWVVLIRWTGCTSGSTTLLSCRTHWKKEQMRFKKQLRNRTRMHVLGTHPSGHLVTFILQCVWLNQKLYKCCATRTSLCTTSAGQWRNLLLQPNVETSKQIFSCWVDVRAHWTIWRCAHTTAGLSAEASGILAGWTRDTGPSVPCCHLHGAWWTCGAWWEGSRVPRLAHWNRIHTADSLSTKRYLPHTLKPNVT